MSNSNNKALIYAFLLGVFPFMVNGWINAKVHTNPALFWGFELFSWIVLPCVIFGYLFKFQYLTWDDLGLHCKINHKKNLGVLFFLCLLAALFTYPIDKIFTQIAVALVGYIPPYFYYQSMQPNTLLLKWLTTLYFALSAGIVEELYYRGLFYKIVESTSHPKLLFLLLSPAIFAIVHWEQGMDNVLETYLFGVFASLFYLKFKIFGRLFLAMSSLIICGFQHDFRTNTAEEGVQNDFICTPTPQTVGKLRLRHPTKPNPLNDQRTLN